MSASISSGVAVDAYLRRYKKHSNRSLMTQPPASKAIVVVLIAQRFLQLWERTQQKQGYSQLRLCPRSNAHSPLSHLPVLVDQELQITNMALFDTQA